MRFISIAPKHELKRLKRFWNGFGVSNQFACRPADVVPRQGMTAKRSPIVAVMRQQFEHRMLVTAF
jgi:hypothetical protein